MPAHLIKPTIGEPELRIVAGRIEKIYRRVVQLERERAESRSIKATPFDPNRPVRSRLMAVEDALSGLRYAVWCIGLTLMALAGRDAMQQVMWMLEGVEDGNRVISWLDHRWDGVTDGSDTWVC